MGSEGKGGEREPRRLEMGLRDLFFPFSVSPPGGRAEEFSFPRVEKKGRPRRRLSGKDGEVVLVAACRSPFGRLGGALKGLAAVELGALSIKELLSRVSPRIGPEHIDYVFLGQVVTAGSGQVPSRQASLLASLPPSVPSITINKVCASGLKAFDLAAQMIRAGRAEVCIAGGQESMSNAPYGLPEMRFGIRMGLPARPVEDLMVKDGLWCPFYDRHMAIHGSEVADEFGITREEQDDWALHSQQAAASAGEAGLLAAEVFPLLAPGDRGPRMIDRDEAPRPETSRESLACLPPVFGHVSTVTGRPGSVTAGNAPGVNDGGAAGLLMSRRRAKELNLEPLGTILDYAEVSLPPKDIACAPGLAVRKLLSQNGLTPKQVDLFEINEAFAAVVLVSGRGILGFEGDELKKKVNVKGGAIAYGHPSGASGARILMTIAYELRRRGGGVGVAGICSGAAQGDAILIKV